MQRTFFRLGAIHVSSTNNTFGDDTDGLLVRRSSVDVEVKCIELPSVTQSRVILLFNHFSGYLSVHRLYKNIRREWYYHDMAVGEKIFDSKYVSCAWNNRQYSYYRVIIWFPSTKPSGYVAMIEHGIFIENDSEQSTHHAYHKSSPQFLRKQPESWTCALRIEVDVQITSFEHCSWFIWIATFELFCKLQENK